MNIVYLCSIRNVPWIEAPRTLVIFLIRGDPVPQSLTNPTVMDATGVRVVHGQWQVRHADQAHRRAYYAPDNPKVASVNFDGAEYLEGMDPST
jgi:hypothetical protein